MSRARDTADQINRVNSSAADATAITVDSSERVLIGKTDTTFSTAGNVFYGDGSSDHTRNGLLLQLNRTTTDGEHIRLLKDGSTVGSIGVNSGDQVYFAASDGMGIKVDTDNTSVEASNASGADNDNAVNLGSSGTRWKDLYLSGGVYLGGTGSANKLEDYEEGTWTPTANFNSSGSATHTRQTGTYTKIGRFVYCDISIIFSKNTGSGTLQIINFPFSNTNGQDRGTASFGYFSGLNGIPIGLMDSNTNKIDIRTALHSTSYNDDANGNASITDGDLDAETNFHFSVIYKTSA